MTEKERLILEAKHDALYSALVYFRQWDDNVHNVRGSGHKYFTVDDIERGLNAVDVERTTRLDNLKEQLTELILNGQQTAVGRKKTLEKILEILTEV